jgi:hypothetical protein
VLVLLAGCGRFEFDSHADAMAGPLPVIEIAPPAFSTASTTYLAVPGATMTIPPSPGTTWLFVMSAGLRSTTEVSVCVEARYLVDGVERGMGGTQGGGAGPWQHFYAFAGSEAAQTITFELHDVCGSTVTIEQLHAVALPLPANAEPHYASVDDVQLITAQSPSPATVPLSLGAMAGEYFVLLTVTNTDAPGEADMYAEWLGPSTEILMRNSQNPRLPWQTTLMARVMPVAMPDAVFTLRSFVGLSSTGGQQRNVRAFAMRTDAFASLDQVLTSQLVTATSATPVTATQLAPIGVADRYLYLATAWSDEECPIVGDSLRRLHFFVDADERRFDHAPDNCALQVTYGTVGLLASRPATVATAVSAGAPNPINVRESQIVVLGLP